MSGLTPLRLFRRFSTTGRTRDAAKAVPQIRKDLDHPDVSRLKNIEDLTVFDPILDIHPSKVVQLTPKVKATFIDPYETPIFEENPRSIEKLAAQNEFEGVTQLTPREIKQLYRFPLVVKRVVQQTGKGKMQQTYALVVAGDGKGLVGCGEAKHTSPFSAAEKAFTQAVKNLDYVRRFEDRTIWGNLKAKFGSCEIHMRPRPYGFGLRVHNHIHQVAKAAGISDLSAKVHGSRNDTRIIKLAVAMLHGGHVPVDLDQFGHKGQRANKKTNGMKTAHEVASLRGRKVTVV